MNILHLIDSLDYSGSARQIQLLGPVLARGSTSLEICCLGPDTPWTGRLRQSGVTVHTLKWTRWIDPSVLWNLHEILRNASPDLIHVWRLPALRALAIVAKDLLPRTVMSTPLPASGKLAWWDRWLLQQVRCLAVAGVSDQELCLRHGVTQPTLRVVGPAVAEAEAHTDTKPRPLQILCAGQMERETGHRQAIWAFDIISQLYPDAQLNLVGTGSQQSTLRALARGLQNDAVHFLGAQADATPVLSSADVVWIPSMANCGRQVALEAMALGRAVIAADVPCLRDVILDGETGFLASRGDVVQFARRTRLLFQDQALRERLGQTARQSVRQRFAVADAVERWRDLYRSVAA